MFTRDKIIRIFIPTGLFIPGFLYLPGYLYCALYQVTTPSLTLSLTGCRSNQLMPAIVSQFYESQNLYFGADNGTSYYGTSWQILPNVGLCPNNNLGQTFNCRRLNLRFADADGGSDGSDNSSGDDCFDGNQDKESDVCLLLDSPTLWSNADQINSAVYNFPSDLQSAASKTLTVRHWITAGLVLGFLGVFLAFYFILLSFMPINNGLATVLVQFKALAVVFHLIVYCTLFAVQIVLWTLVTETDLQKASSYISLFPPTCNINVQVTPIFEGILLFSIIALGIYLLVLLAGLCRYLMLLCEVANPKPPTVELGQPAGYGNFHINSNFTAPSNKLADHEMSAGFMHHRDGYCDACEHSRCRYLETSDSRRYLCSICLQESFSSTYCSSKNCGQTAHVVTSPVTASAVALSSPNSLPKAEPISISTTSPVHKETPISMSNYYAAAAPPVSYTG